MKNEIKIIVIPIERAILPNNSSFIIAALLKRLGSHVVLHSEDFRNMKETTIDVMHDENYDLLELKLNE